ncbi:methionine ABC transporter permease [Stecheria intestinalis]|jgi:D-methionine transport system permease protein|uniref:methionine ABC transporter permease n=1 Tax=Stecheria intestinalis TaxID=2606630 RepID=UPI0023F52D61|nr:methionine ABC transporter permease [Stecheria intestinalis]MCI6746269.1 ABC transporter permease [Anaerolactibacter massiliensis]MDD5881425.1 ABC transporter permease [Stecheria intestinalis]MDY3234422.1 methionine ABC transporter permease [Erysipelotrichaceae bacterium]
MIESTLNVEQLLQAVWETVYMTFVSLFFAAIFGLLIGILLYCTQTGGLLQNKVLNRIVDIIVNVLRAIPFLILLILLIPLTRALVGTMLGAKAALPPLIFASTPFFARMCVIAFQDVDKGTIEAAKAMGASNSQIIFKVLLPESMPAIVSGIAVTGISLVGYTAMAGAIGAGGLGNLAYMYGFARRNDAILYSSTVIIVLIVFVIQWVGDAVVKKIDKR